MIHPNLSNPFIFIGHTLIERSATDVYRWFVPYTDNGSPVRYRLIATYPYEVLPPRAKKHFSSERSFMVTPAEPRTRLAYQREVQKYALVSRL